MLWALSFIFYTRVSALYQLLDSHVFIIRVFICNLPICGFSK